MIPLRNLKRFAQKALKQPGYALGVAARRLRAYVSYGLGRGGSAPPEAITFFLTHACNLRCRMCGQWGDHGVTRQEGSQDLGHELPLDKIREILKDVRRYRPAVTLFGGEPFLHPDIMEIIRDVKKNGLHGLVISNGTLLERFADDVVAAGLDELNISIDGGRALHEEIRGLPGIFDRIMAGIARVNAVKNELQKDKPLINLQCTVSRYNYERLSELLEVAREAKANSLTFHHLIFLSRSLVDQQKVFDEKLSCSSRGWEGFVFEPGIEAGKLVEKLHEIQDLARDQNFSVDIFPNFSSQGVVAYYLNPDYLPSEYAPRCVSPWICAYIFPDGGVRPCLNGTYAFGNVRQADFMKIWNSPEAVRYRQALKKEGIFPACRRCTELYRY